jgi:hypothetical protein
MMKLILAVCVVATFATEAPVISLDLEGAGLKSKNSGYHTRATNRDFHREGGGVGRDERSRGH